MFTSMNFLNLHSVKQISMEKGDNWNHWLDFQLNWKVRNHLFQGGTTLTNWVSKEECLNFKHHSYLFTHFKVPFKFWWYFFCNFFAFVLVLITKQQTSEQWAILVPLFSCVRRKTLLLILWISEFISYYVLHTF